MEYESTPVWPVQHSTDLFVLSVFQVMLLYLYTLLTTCQFAGPLVLNVAIAGIVLIVLNIFQQLRWLRTQSPLIFCTLTFSRILFQILLIGTWVILIH
jgi:hypothetical protein